MSISWDSIIMAAVNDETYFTIVIYDVGLKTYKKETKL